MNNPKVSVIVPVYNVEQYLLDCVDSVLSQSEKSIELILVDDGSTDKSGVLCEEVKNEDRRVQVYHQRNAGAACARNTGVKHASGKYICFIDSDDKIECNYCEVLIALLDESDCDYAVCGSDRFNEKVTVGCFNLVDGRISNQEYLWCQLHRKSEFGFWNKMFRRCVFDKLHFYEGIHNEDVVFSCDLAKNFSHGVICTSQILYHYRVNENGVTAGQNKKADPDRVFAGRYIVETAKSLDVSMLSECFAYAIKYPWSFVDRIYINRTFSDNALFLNQLQSLIRDYLSECKKQLPGIEDLERKRMLLFAKSKALYLLNAYGRYCRMVIYNKVIKKDPYIGGHGI